MKPTDDTTPATGDPLELQPDVVISRLQTELCEATGDLTSINAESLVHREMIKAWTERDAITKERDELSAALDVVLKERTELMVKLDAMTKQRDAIRICFSEASHAAGPIVVKLEMKLAKCWEVLEKWLTADSSDASQLRDMLGEVCDAYAKELGYNYDPRNRPVTSDLIDRARTLIDQSAGRDAAKASSPV